MKHSATLFAVLSAIVMIAAVVSGLIVIGSPSEFRMRRFDERRANDLASISSAVRTYRLTHESLPQKLGDLEAAITYNLKDPVGRPYEYAIKDEFSYELCAEFDTTTDTLTATRFRSVFEKHGSGRQCFTQEARPPARR
jgi:hypothetical protein